MDVFIEDYPALVWILSTSFGVLALLLCGYLFYQLRRFRRDQKTVMGGNRDHDLVAHARALQERIDALAYDIKRLSDDLSTSNRRLDDCLAFRSVTRYDAYRDLSGMQSTSVVLLDTLFSGVVISAIQSRDHARIYVKEIRHGESSEKLSPEEVQVLKEAMGLKVESAGRKAAGGGASAG